MKKNYFFIKGLMRCEKQTELSVLFPLYLFFESQNWEYLFLI